MKKYIENMSWMGLANLSEKHYSLMFVNEFYSGLFLRFDEYKNLPRFNHEVLYTFIDGHKREIIESDLGKLLGCEFYGDLFEAPKHYQIDNVCDTLAREPGCKKVASNLKSLPLRFLHHFIASSIQCRLRSFAKLTTNDIWLLEMASTGTKINLAHFIMKKMLKIMNEKENEAKSKRKKTSLSQFAIPYVTFMTSSLITPSLRSFSNQSMN